MNVSRKLSIKLRAQGINPGNDQKEPVNLGEIYWLMNSWRNILKENPTINIL